MSNPAQLEDVTHQSLLALLGTRCFGNAGLAEGTNANTFQTANDVDYCIDGVMYTLDATDNIAPESGGAAYAQQGNNTRCAYLISVNAAGDVHMTPGAIVATGEDAYLPECPDDECPIGAILVVTAAATFTAGSTDLGAANVTDTYTNLSCLTGAAF